MLKNAETMNNNPHAAHAENNIAPISAAALGPLLTTPVQPALTGMIQNPAVPVTDKLTPRVGTPAWDQGFSQKIVWMAGSATQSASISLNPPDLGPLQVVLNVTNDQANATFIAAQPEVRLAIEAALPKLREMMSDAGIQLGQANVSADTSSQQGSQSDSPASRQSGAMRETIMDNVNIPIKTVSGQGLVNTFV
jgi:Flagellar hook-length control protein